SGIAGAERDQYDTRIARERPREAYRDAVVVERGRSGKDRNLAAVDTRGMQIMGEVLNGAHRHADQLGGRCRRRHERRSPGQRALGCALLLGAGPRAWRAAHVATEAAITVALLADAFRFPHVFSILPLCPLVVPDRLREEARCCARGRGDRRREWKLGLEIA